MSRQSNNPNSTPRSTSLRQLLALPTYLKTAFQNRFFNRHLGNHAVETYYALAEACIIGIVSALAALLLKQGIGALGRFRLYSVNHWGVWILPVFGFIFCWSAGWLVEYLSPAAKGSGIPQVKAALAKFPVPLSLRVALVKMLGTTLILGAGLTLGRRGPTVHIGAALAAGLSDWVPTSPQHRRQMIAAGAAAGLAAGFNTPIAGVLFVVEELSRDMSGLTLETAILASFTGSVVSRLLGSADLNFTSTLLTPVMADEFTAVDIPFYFLLGALAGGLGVLFNQGILTSLALNRRWKWSMAWRMGVVGLVSGLIIAFAPPVFRNNAGLRDFLITEEVGMQQTSLVFLAHFSLTLLVYGTGAPGGVFAPALVLGLALGYWVGGIKALLIGAASTTPYALVGMGAFFTAVARVPVTAIVIVFELTGNFSLVLPLMIGSVMAYGVAETLKTGSLYQHLLEASGIPLRDEDNSYDFLSNLRAGDVMQRQVETLEAHVTVEDTFQFFSGSVHHGFPVVDDGKLVGLVTEAHLAELGRKSWQLPLQEVMTMRPVTVQPYAPLSDVLYLMDRYQISHLPVTEGRRLVGIITRSDLIHATADRLSARQLPREKQPEPSYVVYQHRAPATGSGRLLVPLANPETVAALLKIAVAIARERRLEIECLHIVTVPRHLSPAQVDADLQESFQLFDQASAIAQAWDVPLHVQIRIAHDTALAVLETINERHINLLLMGWKGSTSTPGRIFGDVVDTLIHQAGCDVLLVKLGNPPHAYPLPSATPSTWVIPMAGGPNVKRALQLLPALSLLANSPHMMLCQVYSPDEKAFDLTALEDAATRLKSKLATEVTALPVRSQSVSEAVLRLAEEENSDLVIMGASRESLLKQALNGNIPEAIASGLQCTVILVRSALE
ncbi:MAG: universal stress protein [Kamptonema sp. SIO4C4]|nr:universal stress protein [Kamptonema sp. SIO4C4]